MAKIKIYISPSQQDKNTGPGGYNEKEQMHLLADRVEALLKQYPEFEVYRANRNMTVSQNVTESNRLGVDMHLSLHSNASAGAPTARGTEVYIYNRGGIAEKLANNIYNDLVKVVPAPGRGVKVNPNLYELNATSAPAVLVEVDFHDNPQGAQWIMANLDKIAVAIVDGVLKTYNVAPKPNPQPTTTQMLFNGKPITVERIFINDTNYIKLRDLEKMGFSVGYDAAQKMPVVNYPAQ